MADEQPVIIISELDRFRVDGESLLWGFVWGLLLGGLVGLFLIPRSGVENRRQLIASSRQIRQQLEDVVTPTDPVAESIAEGKAAARRRRAELGLE